MSFKCEVCGKELADKDENTCRGCWHVVCVDCCQDQDGDWIIGCHTIRAHKIAFKAKSEVQIKNTESEEKK